MDLVGFPSKNPCQAPKSSNPIKTKPLVNGRAVLSTPLKWNQQQKKAPRARRGLSFASLNNLDRTL